MPAAPTEGARSLRGHLAIEAVNRKPGVLVYQHGVVPATTTDPLLRDTSSYSSTASIDQVIAAGIQDGV